MSTSKRKKPITLPSEDPKLQTSGSSRTPSESRNGPQEIYDDKKKISILVADDESVVRDGVVAILSFQSDMKVVGEAEDGIGVVEIACQTKPDVILLDMRMPKQNGLEAILQLKKLAPDSKILILTSFAESNIVYESIRAGALGFLLKDARRDQLLQSIRDVAKGQASIQRSIAMEVIHEIEHPAEIQYTASPLSSRELETLRLIAKGLSNQEIATALVVHERVVAKYVSNILEKLHLANRTQAALYAINTELNERSKSSADE